MAVPRPESTTISSAAGALEMFAIATGQFHADQSTLLAQAPFPSSLWTGLGAERLDVLDDLVAGLAKLRAQWADYREAHPDAE